MKDIFTGTGLNCIRVVNEPTMAALTFQIQKRKEEIEYSMLCVDVGHTHSSVTKLNLEDGIFEILETQNNSIGGKEFDDRILMHCIKIYEKETG